MIPFPIKAICEKCEQRHVDPDNAPAHHKHLCEKCGHVWVFASFDTIGVEWDPRLDSREIWNLRHFDLTPEEAVELASPRRVPALILGEAPGRSTSGDMPMFPHPPQSAGGRLHAFSEMPIRQYIALFDRRNVFDVMGWNAKRAVSIVREIAGQWLDRRIVICGNRVSEAFGYRGPSYRWFYSHGVRCVRIPHPSGRSIILNDATERLRVRRVLREAAELQAEAET